MPPSDLLRFSDPPLSLDPPKRRGPWRKLALIALLPMALLAAAGWYVAAADKFGPVGETGVFRSAQLDAATLARRIEDHRLRSLINLRGPNPDKAWYREQKALLERLDLPYRDIPLHARLLPPQELLHQLYRALDELPRPILVHCLHGNDRAGLASLVTRLREAGSSLEDAAGEVSPLRGAVFPDSAGKQLLAQYRQWLDSKALAHSPERFRDFVFAGYQDAWGNFKYALERVAGQRAPGAEAIKAPAQSGYRISGWAFDPETLAPPTKVEILLEEEPAAETAPDQPRADVVQALGLQEALGSGWELQMPPLEAGRCRDLRLRLTTASGRVWTSPPETRLCPAEA